MRPNFQICLSLHLIAPSLFLNVHSVLPTDIGAVVDDQTPAIINYPMGSIPDLTFCQNSDLLFVLVLNMVEMLLILRQETYNQLSNNVHLCKIVINLSHRVIYPYTPITLCKRLAKYMFLIFTSFYVYGLWYQSYSIFLCIYIIIVYVQCYYIIHYVYTTTSNNYVYLQDWGGLPCYNIESLTEDHSE